MSSSITPDPKNKLILRSKHLIVYLSIAVAMLILGIFLTPSIPDEVIGEVILMIIAVFIEARHKITRK